jgi:hypothetical protein
MYGTVLMLIYMEREWKMGLDREREAGKAGGGWVGGRATEPINREDIKEYYLLGKSMPRNWKWIFTPLAASSKENSLFCQQRKGTNHERVYVLYGCF